MHQGGGGRPTLLPPCSFNALPSLISSRVSTTVAAWHGDSVKSQRLLGRLSTYVYVCMHRNECCTVCVIVWAGGTSRQCFPIQRQSSRFSGSMGSLLGRREHTCPHHISLNLCTQSWRGLMAGGWVGEWVWTDPPWCYINREISHTDTFFIFVLFTCPNSTDPSPQIRPSPRIKTAPRDCARRQGG